MVAKAIIAIVGAGKLGSALAVSLRRAGYAIDAIVVRSGRSLKTSRMLARMVGGRVTSDLSATRANVIWFCVPDSEIARAARASQGAIEWKGRVALHSSGALSSDELDALRRHGAAVASVHPMMTFVRNSRPSLEGVSFALEGDRKAETVARKIVGELGGVCYPIRKNDKAAYHAWGTFASPLLTALLVTTEQAARRAGVPGTIAKKRMIPILRQTLENYAAFDAADAFSGPIIRGDVETVRQHLRILRSIPVVCDVYVSLGLAALQYLPAKNKSALRRALRSRR